MLFAFLTPLKGDTENQITGFKPHLKSLVIRCLMSLTECQYQSIPTAKPEIYHYALANFPHGASGQPVKVALNLSAINLKDETFPRWLMDKCQEFDAEPSQVILEVTETASMDNPLALLENLTQFRIKGFHLSIDDFGVGYSSLVQLARLPFSEMKIDQMFVKNLATPEESHIAPTQFRNSVRQLFLPTSGPNIRKGYYRKEPV